MSKLDKETKRTIAVGFASIAFLLALCAIKLALVAK